LIKILKPVYQSGVVYVKICAKYSLINDVQGN
jgi:hypothetical protein